MTLVETMVALAIGLLVSGAVVVALIAAGTAARHASALMQMEDNGNAAMAVLRQHLAMAGFATVVSIDGAGRFLRTSSGASVFGCDAGFRDTRIAFGGLQCASGDAAASIAVLSEANDMNALLSSAGLPLDCLGNGIAATTVDGRTIHRADTRFFVSAVAGTSRRELYCKGAGASAAQPLIEGVEDLRFSYGLAQGDRVDWRDAAAMSSSDWSAVVAVRICLLTTSADEAADTATSHADCHGRAMRPDRRLYRTLRTTVGLPNRLDAS